MQLTWWSAGMRCVTSAELMAADGTLRWDVPARGVDCAARSDAPTGTKNSPAPPEATGFEVDKMNRADLKVAL